MFTDNDAHRLRQGIVELGEDAPVADCAGENHHAYSQGQQGENAADVRNRDRASRIARLFGGHSHTLDREKQPNSERSGGEHTMESRGVQMVFPRPAMVEEVSPVRTGSDNGHKENEFDNSGHGDHKLEACRETDADDIEQHKQQVDEHCRPSRLEPWERDVEVGTDGERNGGWGEDELDQRGDARKKTDRRTKGAAGIHETARRRSEARS